MTSEEIIRKYVPLPNIPSNKGWYTVKCNVCNDYKKRGGFTFEGEGFGYHCFNCAHKSKFDPNQEISLSDSTRETLQAYGVPLSEFDSMLHSHLASNLTRPHTTTVDDPDRVVITFNNLEIPAWAKQLDADNIAHPFEEYCVDYLIHDRGVDPKDYPFWVLREDLRTSRIYVDWRYRLVIPYYRSDKLIYYQGRLMPLDFAVGGKYKNADVTKDCAIAFVDRLYERTEEPLYITEGFFDAYHIKGVSILGNDMSVQQIEMLNRSPRKKVYIPDRRGNGRIAARQAIKEGWSIAIPEISTCKDMNEAYQRFGLLYLLKELRTKVYTGATAETAMTLYCEGDKRGHKHSK